MNRAAQRGVTLIETMVAALVLLVGVSGVLGLLTMAVSQDSAQGDVATRTAIYSQDKLEQLMALSFCDGASDTTKYPTASSGGSGLGGGPIPPCPAGTPLMAGSTTVGSINPASPVTTPGTGYVDYLDAGAQQTTAAGASYMREWTITTNGSANLKTITVRTSVVNWSGRGLAPSTTLVCMKSNTQ